jgi:hypothetical protein
VCLFGARSRTASVKLGDSQVAGRSVEKLPDAYRTIFMLRDVEDMSTTDAADVLEITEDKMSRSASIEHGRCCARVFAREREWKGKKLSTFTLCGAIGSLRPCLKEFRRTS